MRKRSQSKTYRNLTFIFLIQKHKDHDMYYDFIVKNFGKKAETPISMLKKIKRKILGFILSLIKLS